MHRLSFLALLILFAISEPVRADEIKKLDGYGGYKFGMTIQQAKAVRNDAKMITDCGYVGATVCLRRETEIYGKGAVVEVLFLDTTKLVSQINLSFKRLEPNSSGNCKAVLKTIINPLFDTFGSKNLQPENKKIWQPGISLAEARLS